MELWLQVRWHVFLDSKPEMTVLSNSSLPPPTTLPPCRACRSPRESHKGRLLKQATRQRPALCGLREEHRVLLSPSQWCIDPILGKINVGEDRRKVAQTRLSFEVPSNIPTQQQPSASAPPAQPPPGLESPLRVGLPVVRGMVWTKECQGQAIMGSNTLMWW